MAGIVEPRGMVDLQADQTNPLLRTREYISTITLLSLEERVRVFSIGTCTIVFAVHIQPGMLAWTWHTAGSVGVYPLRCLCRLPTEEKNCAQKIYQYPLSLPFGAIELFPAPVGAVAGRASITPIPNIVHFGGFNVDQTQTFKLVSSNRFTTFLLPSSSSYPRFPLPFAFVCTAIVCPSASS